MTPQQAQLLIFIGAAGFMAAIAALVFDRYLREQWTVQDRLRDRLVSGNSKGRSRRSPLFRDLKTLQDQTRQGQLQFWQKFTTSVEQSGLPLSPKALLTVAAVMGALASVLTLVLSPLWWLSVPVGLLATSVTFIVVENRRRARILALCRQLPEAFDQMKRAMRAGHSLPSAMQIAAADMHPPIAEELANCCKQQELGLPLPTALQDLARRTGVMELQIFAVAMVVQRESGGNCLELFTNLADLVRKRIHLVARVKAFTSEGRMQAIVLGTLPILAFAAILFLDPGYAQPLLERPLVLAGLAASEIAGTLWIRKIINIEY